MAQIQQKFIFFSGFEVDIADFFFSSNIELHTVSKTWPPGLSHLSAFRHCKEKQRMKKAWSVSSMAPPCH